MAEPSLAAILGAPFDEQVTALRLRMARLVPTARWDDLWQSQHETAFAVSGAMKADLLADLAGAVEKIAADGATLEGFRREFRDIVARRGWHGWTGEGTVAGEAWRTRVIYQTNIRTSYAAGRMAQLVEGDYPLWIYHHGNSREPRPEHLAWDGLALPPDHPFWKTHAPPNGWGCSCYITGVHSPEAARRQGARPGDAPPEGWDALDARSGAPAGIDRGWAYAPGRGVAETITALTPKLSGLPAQLAADVIQSWLASDAFARWAANPRRDTAFPLVRIPDVDAEVIGAQTRVAVISPETMAKQLRQHPELTASDYAAAQTVVDHATTRLTDRDPRSGALSRIFVLDQSDDSSGGHVLVVKATLSGAGLFVTSFRRLSRDEALRDAEVARLMRRVVRRNPERK